ncbi:MAG: NAD(P)-dependent oxidoreductase [Kofleriaceae bacterium]
MKIGVIGLGHMGSAMANNLLSVGHALTVYNRTPGKARVLAARGATVAARPADACTGDLVLTMVADDAAVERVAFGADGVIAHLAPGAVHACSSTISLAMARRLATAHAEAGQAFVAAPVLGRPAAAEAGELFVLAAGDAEALRVAEPVFDAIGQRTFVISDRPELAIVTKLASNFLIASAIEAMGEALALVEKAGVDPQHYLAIATSTLFDAPVYRTYGALIADRAFEPAEFGASLGEKDIRLALAAGEELYVPMPLASLLRDRLLTLIAGGGERLDWSAIGGLAARDAGVLGQ